MAKPKRRTPKPPKDPAAPPETKADKFVRLATSRVTKACRAIYSVGMLGSNSYTSTPEQIDKVRMVLQAAVDGTMNRLTKSETKPVGFTL